MKIIDTYWEKRNLGVDAVEFDVDISDDETVIDDILGNQKQYNVVKLPVNKPGIMALLQENGYSFAECMLSFRHDLSEREFTEVIRMISADITYVPMNDSDVEVLFTELDKNMFNTDRIYNDPRFSAKIAATRYKNWIYDERMRGAGVFKVDLEGTAIGFFAVKKCDDNMFDQFLVGLYNDYKGKGFGTAAVFGAVAEGISQRAAAVTTHVSSNNPGSIKVHKAVGYEVTGAKYVFIKHVF